LQSFSDLPGSALRHCISPAPGVTTPMLYIGMLYATFAWHVEDHFMYSINYSHAGASKVWYCVPASAADDVETTAAETVYRDPCTTMIEEQGASLQACNEAVAEALAGKTTSMSPRYLVKKGIPVYRAVQEAGSYVITFPRSYHSGFSTGFNLGEAVNFTLSDWWPFGEHAGRLYRSFNRQQIISHEQVLCDEASALAAKLDTLGSMRHLSREDRPVAIAFVAMMQKLHRLRENFQAKKISQVATCSPDVEPTAAEMRNSIPCKRCSHHSYLVSAVADARKVQNEWQHLCLECAAAAEDDAAAGASGADSSLSSHVMVYVKPLWYKMENISKLFTYLLGNQQPAQHVEEEELANTAAVAVVVHQTLSLDGCSEKAIEDLDVLYRYNWTTLDEPLVDAPSWVAKQPETTIIPPAVGRRADADGEFSLHVRKRSLEDADHADEPNSTLPQREHHQQQMGKDAAEAAAIEEKQTTTTTTTSGRAPRISLTSMAMKNKEISFHYTASASTLPTLEATFVRNDAITLPGIKKPVDRRVYRLNSTGETVIFGSDVVRVVCPSQAKSGGMSRFLGRILYIATNNDASAPDKHLVYITGVRNRRSPAIGRSGAAVLLESEMMRERDDYGVLSAMLHGVWEDVEDTSVPGKEEEEEEKGVQVQVIPAPAGTTIIPQHASWKKKRASAGPATKKNTFSKRQKVSVVEEEESHQAEPRVFFQNAEPVALLLLQPPPKAPSPPPAELPLSQPAIPLTEPQEQQPQPNNTAETTVPQEVQHVDKIIIDKITVAEASNNTGVPELGGANDKKFTAFPSLFNGDKDSASLALSPQAFPTALNATISAAEDPEEIEVEIEAENNRTCGEDSDGAGARGNASDEKKAASPASTNAPSPSAAPSPCTEITVEELPPIEEDVLALMEAQFSQDVAAAAAAIASHQQMQAPPPAAAAAPTTYYASHTLAQPEYNNIYTSLDPILINEPKQQEHSYQQLHHQRLMEHSAAAAQDSAPLFSLFHSRQLLGGNNWNATGNLHRNQHVDMNLQNHHHMGIRPLYVPPPSGGAGGGAGDGGGDSGGGRSSTAGWNCNTREIRRW
jgi:hypothetical protein